MRRAVWGGGLIDPTPTPLPTPYTVSRVVVGKHTATTRVEWDSLNPDFDESFSIPIDPSRTRTITFQVGGRRVG